MEKVGGHAPYLKKNEKAHVAYIYQVYKHSYFGAEEERRKLKS